MFDRRMYKKQARAQLKGRWKLPVLITALSAAIAGCLSEPTVQSAGTEVAAKAHSVHITTSAPLVFSVLLIAANGILSVAAAAVYLRLSRTEQPASFRHFLGGLERWLGGALGGLWFALWTYLWALLLVIPGIVKAVAYSQMFFVLAEHREVGPVKAMRISKIMTQGHKADLFVQVLSFVPWALVALCTAGIGFLWLIPYMQMTFTNSYTALKNEALASGRLCPADFGGR